VTTKARLLLRCLNQGAWGLLLLVWAIFTILNPAFGTVDNLTNLLIQSSSTILLATGMTFVLLTGGVDLSIGAIMLVSAAVLGKLAVAGVSLPVILLLVLLTAVGFGVINGFLIAVLDVIPFVATLATLSIGRGLGLWLTNTHAIHLPGIYLTLGSQRIGGVPVPIIVALVCAVCAQLLISGTPFGRYLLATGFRRITAERVGIPTRRVLFTTYCLSGLFAGIGALVSLTQLGSVSPTFGLNREFTSIAAAVIGGTSLSGGRGTVIPGAILGALLIQSIENGLVIMNADPYLYPLAASAVILSAVLLDGLRTRMIAELQRRPIFHDHATE